MPNILIIEDDASLRETLALALEAPGCVIRCANCGEAGLEVLKEWAPDVVITDYMLPKMDGIELIKRITRIEKADYGDKSITRIKSNYMDDKAGVDLCVDPECNNLKGGHPPPLSYGETGTGPPLRTYGNQNNVMGYQNRPFIILLSAVMDRELEARAKKAGASYCMQKPFDVDVLRAIIESR